MRTNVCFIVIFILLIRVSVSALERFDIITTQDLEQMLTDREVGKADFVLVNALDEIIFRNSSIPGSVNVPWSKVNETFYQLGDDKEKLIITY